MQYSSFGVCSMQADLGGPHEAEKHISAKYNDYRNPWQSRSIVVEYDSPLFSEIMRAMFLRAVVTSLPMPPVDEE